MYFTSNDGPQNTFVYQPTLDTLELKIDMGNDDIQREYWWNHGDYILLNLSHYILLSCIA